MPPSSDVFGKPKLTRDRRKPTARKPGKQPGAPGSRLEFVSDPDEVVDHVPTECGGCGVVTAAAAPSGVDGPVVFGPNLRTLVVYLVVFQHVPVERAALLIADLTGATVSTGRVCAQVARTAQALVAVEALIKALLTAAVVLGTDETTVNVAGTKQWLHVARTDLLTAFHLYSSRGRKAVNEFGVVPDLPWHPGPRRPVGHNRSSGSPPT